MSEIRTGYGELLLIIHDEIYGEEMSKMRYLQNLKYKNEKPFNSCFISYYKFIAN